MNEGTLNKKIWSVKWAPWVAYVLACTENKYFNLAQIYSNVIKEWPIASHLTPSSTPVPSCCSWCWPCETDLNLRWILSKTQSTAHEQGYVCLNVLYFTTSERIKHTSHAVRPTSATSLISVRCSFYCNNFHPNHVIESEYQKSNRQEG